MITAALGMPCLQLGSPGNLRGVKGKPAAIGSGKLQGVSLEINVHNAVDKPWKASVIHEKLLLKNSTKMDLLLLIFGSAIFKEICSSGRFFMVFQEFSRNIFYFQIDFYLHDSDSCGAFHIRNDAQSGDDVGLASVSLGKACSRSLASQPPGWLMMFSVKKS